METGREARPGSGHNARYLTIAILCAAVILAAALFSRPFPRGSAERIAFAVVQSAASAVVICMPLFELRHLDEMKQRIQLEALSIAFVGTGLLGATYGFLEHAGLPRVEWGIFLWPAMVVFWVIGTLVACRRYR